MWIKIAFTFFPWLGISTRDDALEGRNPAGLITLVGAMLSLAFIYAGGSAGESSSYSNNIFSAALGTLGFFALWLMLELGAHVSVSITVERDLGSGWRLGGFLFAIGLIFGRAEAGNWHSELATFHDFIEDGWPVLPLLTLALFGEWFLRPSRKQPFPSWARCGLCPALAYLLLAILWVWHLGRWEGMPR